MASSIQNVLYHSSMLQLIFVLQEELSPIQNAIENMEDVNRKLKALIIQHEEDQTLPLNPLSLQLNGVIDSAVMGGPVMYERVSL